MRRVSRAENEVRSIVERNGNLKIGAAGGDVNEIFI